MIQHKVCLPLSKPDDVVYIAASALHWPDDYSGYWWATYRLVEVNGEEQIEIARIKQSLSSGMLGQTIETVPRFDMVFDSGNVLTHLGFRDEDGAMLGIAVRNSRRIFDYAEP